jgi:hypothetical protein
MSRLKQINAMDKKAIGGAVFIEGTKEQSMHYAK